MGINLSDVATNDGNSEFKTIPEGRYNFIVEDAKQDIAKSTGNDILKLTLSITDDQFKNRKLWHTLTFTENALKFVKMFLEAIGSSLVNSKDIEISDIIVDVKNKKGSVYVTPGLTTNGNPSSKLSGFKPVETDPLEEPKPEDSKKSLFK